MTYDFNEKLSSAYNNDAFKVKDTTPPNSNILYALIIIDENVFSEI